MTALLSAPSAAQVARISYRQIDYWVRIGLLQPALHTRAARAFNPTELDVAYALGRLSEVGMLSSFGRQVAEHVRTHGLAGCVVSEEPAGFVIVDLDALARIRAAEDDDLLEAAS